MSATTKIEVVRCGDLAAYARVARPVFLVDEAKYCLGLGILDTLTRHPERFPIAYLWTATRAGAPLAAAWMTPPHALCLTEWPQEAVAELAEDVACLAHRPPDVSGPVEVVEAFVDEWSKHVDVRVAMRENLRIYRLEAVRAPRTVPGRMRAARPEERKLLVDWTLAFAIDCDQHDSRARAEEAADFALRTKARMFWEVDGKPRAMAGFSGKTPSGVRVMAVYTPPEERGRGYASALVAAMSQWLLDQGNRSCFLFTDLANPTSNSIYQKIGYEPVSDVSSVRLSY